MRRPVARCLHGGDAAPMAEYARRERLCRSRCAYSAKGGRACGRATCRQVGQSRVDLGAPGEDIVSTYTIAGDYEIASGTSMAAPHVAGVAVLVASLHPEWGYADIKNRILSTTRPLTSLAGKTVTGGVLNALNAVQEPATLPTAPTTLSATAVSDTEITLTWEDNSNNEQGFHERQEVCGTGQWCRKNRSRNQSNKEIGDQYGMPKPSKSKLRAI